MTKEIATISRHPIKYSSGLKHTVLGWVLATTATPPHLPLLLIISSGRIFLCFWDLSVHSVCTFTSQPLTEVMPGNRQSSALHEADSLCTFDVSRLGTNTARSLAVLLLTRCCHRCSVLPPAPRARCGSAPDIPTLQPTFQARSDQSATNVGKPCRVGQ